MTRSDAGAFARILERNRIEYIFVGGVAVRTYYPSETEDFDVMIIPRDYQRAVAAVDRDPAVASMSRGPAEMPGGHVIVHGALVRFDLLDPAAYAGRRSGPEFYDYVKRYASDPSPVGRVARPNVVWYMRLVIDRWELYVPKMLRDLRAGVPWSIADEVQRLAERHGVGRAVRDRLRRLRDDARVVGLLPPERDSAGKHSLRLGK
jgi:hypothetical protein